jgi:hypothetical protein
VVKEKERGVLMENPISTHLSRPARWVWILSLCTALFWIVVAAVSIIRPALQGASLSTMEWVVALLMLGNAAVIVWLGHGLRKGRKLFYYMSLGYLVFNIVLTITDEFGLLDLIYLIYAGALLVALLLCRKKLLN